MSADGAVASPSAASEGTDRQALALDLLGTAGTAALLVGLALLTTGVLGFTVAGAFRGVWSQLGTTVPAAIAVLLAVALEIVAGLVLARIVLRRAISDPAEAVLAGFVAAVVKDVALLGVLGQVGLFDQPILLAIDVVIVAAGTRLGSPVDRRALDLAIPTGPLVALVAIVWAGTVILQLAAPVVPFLDVLPNHVAPAEHLRTFGGLTPLTATQSPIYGPSRSFIGYTALVGALTTMTGLSAALAASAFILPSTLLVAAGVVRLARAISGVRIGVWSLLTFALTASFARLTDARATVVVLPLAAWALANAADALRPSAPRARLAVGRLPEGVILGLGLGATVLVHPVIGALAVATVVIVAVAMPDRMGRIGFVASVTAAVLGAPQAATMVGIALPALAVFLAIPLAIGVGLGLDHLEWLHRPVLAVGRVVAVALVPIAILFAGPLAAALASGLVPLVSSMEVSLAIVAVGIAVGAMRMWSPVLGAALLAGMIVAGLTQLLPPENGGLLTDAIRYEVPKTLQYWVPVFVAVAAAIALHTLWTHDALRLAVKVVIVGAFLVAAAVPIRSAPIDILHLGEHRFSETLAIDLHYAERGYWGGYPDPRRIVDAPRTELLTAVRKEIAAGRLGADTPILHVAASFQQWVATPLGVFAGVTETDVTPDAILNIHTVGGRLRPMADLPSLLASRAYPYAMLEPSNALPTNVRAAIVAAGYRSVFANGQGELFALGA